MITLASLQSCERKTLNGGGVVKAEIAYTLFIILKQKKKIMSFFVGGDIVHIIMVFMHLLTIRLMKCRTKGL